MIDPNPVDGSDWSYQWLLNGEAVVGQSGSVDFGGGPSVPDFVLTPADDGLFVVRLEVTDHDAGASYADETRVLVRNLPASVSFSVSGDAFEGSPLAFTESIADPGSADTHALAWSVTLGQSVVAVGSGPGFAFTPGDEGDYQVRLEVVDDDGGLASFAQTIPVANVAPQIDLGGPASFLEGSPISFGLADVYGDPGDDAIASILWQVVASNGQLIPDFTGPDFSFVPVNEGTYAVTLTVTDEDQGVGTDSAVLTVGNAPPAVLLPEDLAVEEGALVSVSAFFSDPGAADTHTFLWQVLASNGQVVPDGSALDFAFVPEDEGLYTLSLTVDDGTDAVTESLFVTVLYVAPQASILAPALLAAPLEGSLLAFDAVAFDPGPNDVVGFAWDVIRDGGPMVAAGAGPSFSFTPDDEGSYLVRLVASDGLDSSEALLTLSVGNAAPQVALGPPLALGEGQRIPLLDAASLFGDPGAAYTHTFLWSPRDAAGNLLLQSTDASFDLPTALQDGSYFVRLEVSDDDGALGAGTLTVEVANLRPQLVVDRFGPVDEDALFMLTGSTSDFAGDVVSVQVDFGDGTVVPVAVTPGSGGGSFGVQHVFAHDGAYQVSVTARDSDGGETPLSLPLIVNDIPPSADLNRDGSLDALDLATLKSIFYSRNPGGDLDESGFVNAGDLRALLDAIAAASAPLVGGSGVEGSSVAIATSSKENGETLADATLRGATVQLSNADLLRLQGDSRRAPRAWRWERAAAAPVAATPASALQGVQATSFAAADRSDTAVEDAEVLVREPLYEGEAGRLDPALVEELTFVLGAELAPTA